MRTSTVLVGIVLLLAACRGDDVAVTQPELSFFGKWKFVSHVVSDCLVSTDNHEEHCTGSAEECGVLTLGDKTWDWTQTLADGTVYNESGTFYLSTNTIILTGPASPGTQKYSISGSAMFFTTTTLTFISTGILDECTYTRSYSRYNQPVVPRS